MRLDAVGVGERGDVRRLDAERPHPLGAEALEQRAVIRADIDAQRPGGGLIGVDDRRCRALEIAHQGRRDAAAIGVVGVEEDLRRHRVVDLREAAVAALREMQRIDRLGGVELRGGEQRIAGRLVTEIEHRDERAAAADLAALEMPAGQVMRGDGCRWGLHVLRLAGRARGQAGICHATAVRVKRDHPGYANSRQDRGTIRRRPERSPAERGPAAVDRAARAGR